MLHNLLIINAAGYLLLAKYFDKTTNDEREEWEREVLRLTKQQWAFASNEQVVTTSDDKFIVFRLAGELIVFLTGSDEYDELVVSGILGNFIDNVMAAHMEHKFTENQLITCYTKICIAIDEMIQQGHLELFDAEKIVQLSRSRPAWAKLTSM